MCLTTPARLLSVADDGTARAESAGRTVTVALTALERAAAPGDWVLVQSGLAVAVLDEREATELLHLLEEARDASP